MLGAAQAHHEHAVAHERGVGGTGLGKPQTTEAPTRQEDLVGKGHRARIIHVDDAEVVLVHVLEEPDLRPGVRLMGAVPG